MFYRTLIIILTCLLMAACSSTGKSGKDVDHTGNESTDAQQSPRKIGFESREGGKLFSKKRKKQKLNTQRRSQALDVPPDLIDNTDSKVASADDEFDSGLRVLPEIIGADIIKQNDKTWLEVDADVAAVWHTVDNYWGDRGTNLVEYNPEAGLMETEWLEQEIELDEEGSRIGNFTKSLLSAITNRNSSWDKYRIRFERLASNRTALHVSHRGSARKAVEFSKKISDFEWVELASDPERIADLLQRLVLLFEQPDSIEQS